MFGKYLVSSLFLALLFLASPPSIGGSSLEARLQQVLDNLDPDFLFDLPSGTQQLVDNNIQLHDCAPYPYNKTSLHGETRLVKDLKHALSRGMHCLLGRGPQGALHRYHRYQGYRLLKLLESPSPKHIHCMQDRMFAAAVASSRKMPPPGDPLYGVLRKIGFPGIALDTFRLGGLLSTRHPPDVYRNFFKLNEEQIQQHLSGHPLRPEGTHRYQKLPALLFHEMTHWLGFEHSAIYPDLADLYEACCFEGSEFISDPLANQQISAQACAILRDDDLWQHAYTPYQKMRVWHRKDYDSFKRALRNELY